MKAFYHPDQRAHDPKHFLSSGAPQPNPEQPARVDALLGALERLGVPVDAPGDAGMGPLAAIHTSEYLRFLQTIYTRWQRIAGASAEVIPNIHPDRRTATYPKSAVGQAGYHQADTACPISAETWNSTYWSAQTAVAAADAVLAGERATYALCRPPGHHAFADLAGGFCFLNNTAIAAERCLKAGKRPAILDVDLHHGNGTQGIFYARGDVLTVSIHADPARFYPFFWGHAHERGEGAGLGANLNLPLERGTGDAGFMTALATGLDRIADFGADVIVVALGLDAHESDPFQGLAVTTPGFARIGAEIAATGLPLVIVQEGGYLSEHLGANLESALTGFSGR
ncbi:MAG: histone deacetylase family protein [Rhodobiaceae bacterium]|nr:histone deacetylase family protein [Rhodobiaceae bacterium]